MHICQKRGFHLDPHLFLDKSTTPLVEETQFFWGGGGGVYLTVGYTLYPI